MDSRYKQEVHKYGKKDAITALCAFVAITAFITFFDWLRLQDFHATAIGFILRAIIIGVTIAIVLIKKQGLASIGFHKDKFRQALVFGLLLILFFSVFGVVPGLIYGWKFNTFGTIISVLLITIIMAAGEDIFFVGFLQTRLHGLFKNSALAIFVGAICFGLAHVPAALLLSPYPGSMINMWVIWIIGHTLMVLVFRKQFSIMPVIIAHTLGNFLSVGSLWYDFNSEYNSSWVSMAMLLVFAILLIIEIVRWCQSKKSSNV
ncbi:MAG: CPBP family intramembrane metalloprotease [Defluviitaleaceae bacterium]|nr:CPBP family intramembrane metalloprotease [Defluviitaleaceae bacterium]